MTDLCHGAKVVSNGEKYKNEKTPRSVEITAFLVRLPGLEPGASGLGVWLTM